jgi:hypothetical protein
MQLGNPQGNEIFDFEKVPVMTSLTDCFPREGIINSEGHIIPDENE